MIQAIKKARMMRAFLALSHESSGERLLKDILYAESPGVD